MCEKFLMGVIVGMVSGAYVICNCRKARQMFKEKQQAIMQKINEFKEQPQQESNAQ